MIPPHERKILEAHVRGVRLDQLAFQERPLNEYEDRELKNLIKMRMKGYPLQYLTGSQSFYGRDFYINTHVLIPRPETEGLVELALKNLPPTMDGKRLQGLDFGTGSGCIALTLAIERPDLIMVASEFSQEAYNVAEENAIKWRVGNVHFLQVSETPYLWQYDDVPELDLLISNPPYLIPSDEVALDVRNHEPAEALFVPEEDPIFFYRFLLELMEAKVGQNGISLFEIASNRALQTAEVFSNKNYKVEILKDLSGNDRYLIVRK